MDQIRKTTSICKSKLSDLIAVPNYSQKINTNHIFYFNLSTIIWLYKNNQNSPTSRVKQITLYVHCHGSKQKSIERYVTGLNCL